VKAVLIADKSEAGGKLYSETFENKNPAETRKYLLGPQLTTMSLWPGKLAGSSSPEAQALGLVTEKSTGVAQDLLNDIGTAETKRDQFDLVTRAAFIDTCNAAVKLLFGQLSDLALSPPPGTKMPIPPGFVDRFFLRGTSARPPTIKELEKSIERTKTKLQQQEDLLKELKDKDKKEQKAKQDAAMAQLAKKAADAQKIKDDADAALAKLKAEIEKDTPPDA
jgi:Sec-independent protein translocase protein TatA